MKTIYFKAIYGFLFFCLLAGPQKSFAQIIIPVKLDLQYADRNWEVNDILDSIMNKRQFTTGGIIYVTDSAVVIDTVVMGQVRRIENDSVVIGKFLKKNQKKISSKEFWGVITLSGYCQRFYDFNLFEVWESPSPYIYRLPGDFRSTFYFSENLVSPLYSLDRNAIQNSGLDTSSKRILSAAMDERIKDYQYQVKDERRAAAIDISVNVALAILQVMLWSSGPSHNHSSPAPQHSPRSTGPRR